MPYKDFLLWESQPSNAACILPRSLRRISITFGLWVLYAVSTRECIVFRDICACVRLTKGLQHSKTSRRWMNRLAKMTGYERQSRKETFVGKLLVEATDIVIRNLSFSWI